MRPPSRTSAGALPVPAGRLSVQSYRSTWKRRLLAAGVGFVLLLLLAPFLVAGTPLRNWLLLCTLPHFQGDIRIGGASMGWFRPLVLTDLEIHDSVGRTLLHVPRLQGSKSLAALLWHPFDLGEFHLTQPVVHVVCSRASSNLEVMLAYWLQRTGNTRSGLALEGLALRLVVAQARVVLEDEDNGRTWSLDPLDLTVAIPPNRRTSLRLELSATALPPFPSPSRTGGNEGESGQLSVEASARFVEAADGTPHLQAEGELHASRLPLDAAGPFLHRLAPHLQLSGQLNAEVKLRPPLVSLAGTPGNPEASTPGVQVEGCASLHELMLSDPLLGPDVLRLRQVRAPLRIVLDGKRLAIEQLEIQSEIGKISLGGTMDLAKDLRDALVQPGHRVEAELNLARLAELAPHALHLTKDTHMQSGALLLHLHSVPHDDGVLWQGDLRTSDLEGLYQGQRVVWKEPFALVWTAHQTMNNPLPVLECLRCDSDFLRLEMAGSLHEWTARGSFHLGRLSKHLADFIELGSLRVQGEGTLRAAARRNPRGGYRLESDVSFSQLRLTDGARTWREDSLTIRLDWIGDMTGSYRLDAGAVHVLAGHDGIDLDLLEPIPDVSALRAVRARLHFHGDLARWQERVARLTGWLDGIRLAGQIDIDGRLRYEAETLYLEDIKAAGHAVRLQGFGLSVDEPTLDLTTSGRWLPARATLELQHTRLNCPTVAVQTPTATWNIDPVGAWQITASAMVQGDVARLLSVLGLGKGWAAGALAGRIDLRPDEGRQIVQLDLNVQDLVLGPPTVPIWREARVNLLGRGVYDVVQDSLQIVQLHLDSPALRCDAAGQLSALSSDMELSLQGQLGYDWEKLGPQLRPYLGSGVKLSGRDVRPFHLAGALRGLHWHGDAALSWQALQALGCQIGAAELCGQLTNGCFRAMPIETTLNQGRLHLEPSLRLDPLPLEVTLAKGRAIDHARLDAAACASALGYAVPVLAGAAQADGQFSLDLQSGRVPLAEPAQSDLVGWLTIHSAQISAGPLVQELSVLLKGPATLTLAKDNIVPFRMVNGRIYHTGLELHFPELTIRTSGSVGLDGSLALTAEMPVPPKWLGPSKLAKAALGNQIIRLPIGGTLSHPKIDERALREASATFTRDAAENALRQEIDSKVKKEAENGLRKLFRRK